MKENKNAIPVEHLSGNVAEIEVVECGCGYHMGIDSSYLEQVGSVETVCPSCEEKMFIVGNEE